MTMRDHNPPLPAQPLAENLRPGRQSIARQMWRSLAILLIVLVLSGLISSYLQLDIVHIVQQVVEVEDPLERAILEIEINAGETTQALFNYLTDPQTKHIERYQDANADYQRFAEQIATLAEKSGNPTLGDTVKALQRGYARLGDDIISIASRRDASLMAFEAHVKDVDDLLDESLQKGLDPDRPADRQKLSSALDMEINTDEAANAVDRYVQKADAALRVELDDALADFKHFEALYRRTSMSPVEQGVLDQITQEFASMVDLGQRIMAQTDELESSLKQFRDELERFDDKMDEDLQPLIQQRKAAAYAQTQITSWLALTVIVTMAAIALLIAGLSTWVTTRKIVRSFWTLVTGIEQFAHGNSQHRIAINSDDELGKLSDAFNQMVEQRQQAMDALDEKNQLLEALSTKLSKYLSPQVYESIFKGERAVELSTQRKKLTVFFSDIKDFTATTDDLEPEALTFLLNDYLTEMSSIALRYGATIDKYVGDAMLLFFGDPNSHGAQEDALACVRMAVEMQRHMIGLRAKWEGMGYERPLHMRIGVNTGFCNVGNFGSDERMDYTIIGGEVNLAARLESAAEPDGILMDYETYALVQDHIDAAAQPPIHVKGIAREIHPYAVLGVFDEIEISQSYLRSQNEAMRLHIDLTKLDIQGRIAVAEELEKQAARLRDAV